MNIQNSWVNWRRFTFLRLNCCQVLLVWFYDIWDTMHGHVAWSYLMTVTFLCCCHTDFVMLFLARLKLIMELLLLKNSGWLFTYASSYHRGMSTAFSCICMFVCLCVCLSVHAVKQNTKMATAINTKVGRDIVHGMLWPWGHKVREWVKW